MTSGTRPTSIDFTNLSDGCKSPTSTESLPMLERINQSIGQLKAGQLSLDLRVGQDDGKEEKIPSLTGRIKFLENKCNRLQESLDQMILSRNELSVIRKELEKHIIYFEEDELTPKNENDFKASVTRVIEALNRNNDFILRIQGHCDSIFFRKLKREFKLSASRAILVKDRIIHGFLSQPGKQEKVRDRLEIEALRSTRPHIVDNKLANDRVTFAVVESYGSDLPLKIFPDPLPVEEDVLSVGSAVTGSVNKNGYMELDSKDDLAPNAK